MISAITCDGLQGMFVCKEMARTGTGNVETVQISALYVDASCTLSCALMHSEDPQQVNKCSLN